MRAFLLILLGLVGCAAPTGGASAPPSAAGGLADDGTGAQCLFGEHLDDLVYGGRFSLHDDEILTASTALTGAEDKQLRTAFWDEGVRELSVVFARADRGEIRVEMVESREGDRPPFVMYSWTESDVPEAVLFEAGTLDVVARAIDGWMQACSAAAAPPPGPCRFGETADELLFGGAAGAFEVSEPVTLTAASALTITQQKHVLTGFRRDRVRGLEDAFGRTDDGTIEQTTLNALDAEDPEATDGPFEVYTFRRDGALEGFVFEGEDIDVLARLSGDEVRSCVRFGAD